jgi:hypothetical protein
VAAAVTLVTGRTAGPGPRGQTASLPQQSVRCRGLRASRCRRPASGPPRRGRSPRPAA